MIDKIEIFQVIFLIYDSRSGSTFFCSTVAALCPEIHVTHELHVFKRLFEFEKTNEKFQVKGLVDYLTMDVQSIEAGLTKEIVNDCVQTCKSYEEVFWGIIKILNKESKKILLIKHAPYKNLDRINQIDPSIRFIHLIRDGRGVYESKKRTSNVNSKLMASSLFIAARTWNRKIDLVEKFQKKFPDRVLTLKFESLIENNMNIVNQLRDFVGLKYSKMTSIDYSKSSYVQDIGANQLRLHDNIRKGVLVTKVDEWKVNLLKEEIFLYSIANKNKLQSYSFSKVNIQVRELEIVNFCRIFYWELSYIVKILAQKK